MMNATHWAALGLVVLATAGCATANTGGNTSAASAAPATTQVATAPSGETGRDWSRIDADKDGSVSPTEMEKYLAANPGPLKK